jgi:hypothetical protein
LPKGVDEAVTSLLVHSRDAMKLSMERQVERKAKINVAYNDDFSGCSCFGAKRIIFVVVSGDTSETACRTGDQKHG